MANEDVRVRFSAEGLADVVTAFRTVSSESKKSAAEAGGAWEEFGDQVKDLGKELLGFLAIGELFDGFKESVAQAFERADQIDDFSKATGLSTDAVQGLTAAATKNHIAVDQVEASIGKLTVTIGKARQGQKDALAPFDELKINFQELQKLSPDEQFQEIASKLAAVKNPADQAAIGVQLFGKQFAAIKPVIDDVAKDGLQSYIDHMRDLGILLSSDTVTAMKEVNEQFAELKTRGQGATTQFASGLVPALQQSLDAFLEGAEGGAEGLKTTGEVVGDVLKGLVTIAITVGKAIGDLVGAAVESAKGYISATGDAVKALANGDFSKIPDAFAKGVQNNATQLKTLIASIKEDASETVKSLFGDDQKKPAKESESPAGGAGDDSESIARLKALGQARYQLISAQLDAELAIYTAHAQLLEAQEKQQYQDGTISLQQYYSDRAKIINEEFDKEVATLKAKRAAAAAVPTSQNDAAAQVAQQAQIAQIDGQLQLKEIARQQALAENTVEQRAAQKQLYTDQLTAESKLAQLQGDRYAASQAQLKIQLQQLDDLLKKGGVSDAERQAAIDTARSQAEAMAQFNDQKEQADSQLKSLSTAIAGVQGDIANGTLFQAEGEAKIIELEKSRLPVLQQIAAAQLAAAQASKDPQAIATAEQFAQKVKDIANATDLAGQYMAQFKQGAQDAFQNGLSEFLTDGIQDVHNLGDAFKSLISDILKGMQRVAAEMASQQATKALFGALAGLFGGGGSINEIPSTDYIGSYSSVTASARGNVFSDGQVVHAFAAGGAFTNGVAVQPTMAPMALFGEAGPEAIVPLVRDGNGNLGVRSSGGSGGGDINMETNIVLDSSGNQQSQQSTSNNDLLRQFGDQMNQMAKQSIQREMQPGGLLWRWRNGS